MKAAFSPKRIILHIDFDSFFASVAQQDNPSLRGKPIGITAHNGRTAIIAASREAKAMGVKGVGRTYDAFRLCPQLQLVSADFTRYWEISKKFINICKDYSPTVEIFSIDELFIDATYSSHLFGGVEGMIEKIKTRIRKEAGEYITVSVGISHNKLLAKLASGLKKPNGMVEIKPEQLEQIYAIAKLSDICGIGYRIEARLNEMGIFKLKQLRRTPLSPLIAEFGNVEGHFLYNVGQGHDVRAVIPYSQTPPVKSVSRNYCLPQNEFDKRVVLQQIYELCEEVCIKLRRLDKKAHSGGLALRGESSFGGHMTHDYFDSGSELFGICQEVIKRNAEAFNKGYIRQISVWSGHLTDTAALTLPLFAKERRSEKLIRVIDTINEKFGDHTIRNGFLLYADKLTTVPNGFMADKFERKKLAESSL